MAKGEETNSMNCSCSATTYYYIWAPFKDFVKIVLDRERTKTNTNAIIRCIRVRFRSLVKDSRLLLPAYPIDPRAYSTCDIHLFVRHAQVVRNSCTVIGNNMVRQNMARRPKNAVRLRKRRDGINVQIFRHTRVDMMANTKIFGWFN